MSCTRGPVGLGIVALALLGSVGPAVARDEGPAASGYLENTTGGDWRKAIDDFAAMTGSRLHLDLSASAGEHVEAGAALIGMLYAGSTAFNVLDFLPAHYGEGVPGAFKPLFAFTLRDELWLQEAFVTVYAGPLRLRAGRQKINTGSGYAFNPSDLLNLRNPLDPTYEIEGIDAIRASWTLWGDAQLDLAYVFGSGHFRPRRFEGISDGDWRAALQFQLGRFDLVTEYTAARRPRTDVEGMLAFTVVPASDDPADASTWLRWHFFGGDLSGELFGVGVHAEGGWAIVNAPPAGSRLRRDTLDHGRFLVGMDYTFESQLELVGEYFFNGQGRIDERYDFNERVGLLAGERLTLNRDTVFAGARYPLTELLSVQVYAMIAPRDPSAILNPWLVWEATEGLTVKATAQVPLGGEESQNGRAGPGGFVRARMSF